jgi:hypothetical protein
VALKFQFYSLIMTVVAAVQTQCLLAVPRILGNIWAKLNVDAVIWRQGPAQHGIWSKK